MKRGMAFFIPPIAVLMLALGAACERSHFPQTACPASLDRERNSIVIRDEGYADMPYMVRLPSGDIGMTLTVSSEHEGAGDQNAVFLISQDNGESWHERSMFETSSSPKGSWAMPFMRDGVLYVVYLYNSHNLRFLPGVDGRKPKRQGSVFGDIALRTSSDEGRTWSERKIIPIPISEIDKRNAFAGEERLLWLSGAPVKDKRYVYFGFSKVGEIPESGPSFDTRSFVLRSDRPGDPSRRRGQI